MKTVLTAAQIKRREETELIRIKQDAAAKRKAEQRRKLEESGLVPLRITEVWCTPQQHEYLRLKIAAMIAETITKPAQ